jgi:hypothetical protein
LVHERQAFENQTASNPQKYLYSLSGCKNDEDILCLKQYTNTTTEDERMVRWGKNIQDNNLYSK